MTKSLSNEELQKLALELRNTFDFDDLKWKSKFGLLVETIRPKLANHIRKFIRNEDDAADVLGNVIEKIVNKFYSYDVKYAFSTWTFTIAQNEARHFCNVDKSKFKLAFDSVHSQISEMVSDNSQAIADAEIDMDEILKVMDGVIYSNFEMTDIDLFLDKEFNGRLGSEMSNENDIKANTIKTKMRAIRMKLFDKMKEESPDIHERYLQAAKMI
jgi:hypothetical protein